MLVPVRHRVHGDCRISTKQADKGDSSECQRVERPVVGTTWTALYAFYVRLFYYVPLPLAFDANLLTSMPPLLVVGISCPRQLEKKKWNDEKLADQTAPNLPPAASQSTASSAPRT